MPNNLFFHKYPYTDFHELNLSWVLEQVQDCVDKVDEFDVRLTADEAQISSIDGRLTLIEGSDILDAIVLRTVASVNAAASSVTIQFNKDTYTNGEKASSTDSAVIPGATTTAAGVMSAADKLKLEPITASGDDIAIAGSLSVGAGPTNNDDVATKAYADSLALTGATPTRTQNIVSGSWLNDASVISADGISVTKCGYFAMYSLAMVITVADDIPKESQINRARFITDASPEYLSGHFYIHGKLQRSGDYVKTIPIYVEMYHDGVPYGIVMKNHSDVDLAAGDIIQIDTQTYTMIDYVTPSP